MQRSVSIGQAITPSTVLAVIFNTEFVEVRLPVASRQLASLNLPESQHDPPVDVLLSDALNEEVTTTWQGKIVGTEGALDPNSRELFAIARVADPFSRKVPDGEAKRPPLRIGQPVRAAIGGVILRGVFVIPRSAVRNLKLIYLVDKEAATWQQHEIDPIWTGMDDLIVRDPEIPDRALLATTRQTYEPRIARIEILPDIVEPEKTADSSATKPEEGKNSS